MTNNFKGAKVLVMVKKPGKTNGIKKPPGGWFLLLKVVCVYLKK